MRDLTTALNNLIRSTSLTEVLVRAGQTVQQDEDLLHFDRDDLAAALRQSDAQFGRRTGPKPASRTEPA